MHNKNYDLNPTLYKGPLVVTYIKEFHKREESTSHPPRTAKRQTSLYEYQAN
jgi:hypothetical protein